MEVIKDPIIKSEHSVFQLESGREYKDLIGMPDYMGTPSYLGIGLNSVYTDENNEKTYNYSSSYFIGASLLPDNDQKKAVCIVPKIENLDYPALWNIALKVDTPNDYFDKCYGFYEDQEVEIENPLLESILTPLIIIHFLKVLSQLLPHGLKKDYVQREENLNYKVKGRFVMSSHLTKNVFYDRSDRNYCSFQEYTVNTPVNQLLKCALIVSKNWLSSAKGNKFSDSLTRVNKYLSEFALVDENQNVKRVTNKGSKLYKDYSKAVNLAHIILRRIDYSINKGNSKDNSKRSVPPFWMDMSRLFEMYVLHKLQTSFSEAEITFQAKGYTGFSDYVLKYETEERVYRMVIDAKYKPRYTKRNCHDAEVIGDIREISGYARDNKIRKLLDAGENDIVDCVVVYPSNMTDGDGEYTIGKEFSSTPECLLEDKMEYFTHFSKFCIKLPLLS